MVTVTELENKILKTYSQPNDGYPRILLALGSDEWRQENSRSFTSNILSAAQVNENLNLKFFQEQGANSSTAESLIVSLQRIVNSRNGDSLLSALLLNIYLSEVREETFGEFLASRGNEILDEILSFSIPVHSMSELVFSAHSSINFILTHRRRGLKSARDRIESLNQKDIIYILKVPNGPRATVARPTLVVNLIDSILAAARGEQVKAPTILHTQNVAYRAYAQAVLNTHEMISYRLDDLGFEASRTISSLYSVQYADPKKAKLGQVSSTEVLKFVKFLELNAHKISPQKILALYNALKEPGLFARGPAKGLRTFLIELIDQDDAIEILEAVAEFIVEYAGYLPTLKEWTRGRDEQLLNVGSSAIMAELIASDTMTRDRRKNQQQLRRRLQLT